MKKICFCLIFLLVWIPSVFAAVYCSEQPQTKTAVETESEAIMNEIDVDTNVNSLTIDYCYEKARNNHPLIKQFALAAQSAKYKSAGAGRHFLPQISISARASWQTDVTAFSQDILDKLAMMGISGVNFPDKDQYRAVVELVQPVWDGGALVFERAHIKAEAEVDRQTAEVALYALYSQINQVYFGILLLRGQLRQNNLFTDELQRQYNRIVDLEHSGLANESDILRIEVEQKKLVQVKEEILKGLQVQGFVLSFYLGERVSWTSVSALPPTPNVPTAFELSRPEIAFFYAQQREIDAQKKRLLVKGMPQLGLFAQGAYANPGLNMFDAGFKPYFIGGVSFSWNFGGLYTYGDEKKILSVAREKVKVQEENFRFMLDRQLIVRNGEIEKLDRAILRDDEIIVLREKIARMSEIKCNNGTLSVSDYIGDLNELNIARQTRAIHEIERLKTMYDLQIDRGIEN